MDDISLEDVVLQNLLTNESYLRKVIPFIKEEYFSNRRQSVYFSLFGFLL